MAKSNDEVTLEFLQTFADAWNRHDLDALMECMADDCVYETSSGDDVCGTRYVGRDGKKIKVNGCDFFTFRDGQIAVKNSYRKSRPPIN